VTDIPRTKTGKLVELAVRAAVQGDRIKNAEALANPEALEQFRNRPDLREYLDYRNLCPSRLGSPVGLNHT